MAKSRSKKRARRVTATVAARRKSAKAETRTIVWRHLKLQLRHTPDYISKGWSHTELRVIEPARAPCPITSTGYLSHFLDAADLVAAGGLAAYFTAWLDREAATKAWAKTEAAWRQLDLFGRPGS